MTDKTLSPTRAHLLTTTALCGALAGLSPEPVATPFTGYMKRLDASLAGGKAVPQ